MNVLNKMADLMWLNILTLICCIHYYCRSGITSMHYVALKIVRNEEVILPEAFSNHLRQISARQP